MKKISSWLKSVWGWLSNKIGKPVDKGIVKIGDVCFIVLMAIITFGGKISDHISGKLGGAGNLTKRAGKKMCGPLKIIGRFLYVMLAGIFSAVVWLSTNIPYVYETVRRKFKTSLMRNEWPAFYALVFGFLIFCFGVIYFKT
jgi:hypothetical protein